MNDPDQNDSYRAAGVDIDAGHEVLTRIHSAVTRTHGPAVLAGLGAFGGLYHASALKAMDDPVLVASTDGVGTKTKLASALGRYRGIGTDIVHHCLNDILVQGATGLFFLDYVAFNRLEPNVVADIVTGVAEACEAAGVALLGGETAEMPGVYTEGEFDLVGTIVGVVERASIVDSRRVEAGDKVLALASGGLQTNGFSLARKVLARALDEPLGERTVGETLLTPHRSYLASVKPLLKTPYLRGMAHITGGGLLDNIPRVLPQGLGVTVKLGSWPVPEIFTLIQERGQVSVHEMHRVFNMGAGFVLIASPADEAALRQACPETLYPIGEVVPREGVTLEP